MTCANADKGNFGMTDITIEDDFEPQKIVISGQCFRAKDLGDKGCRFITGNDIVYIKKLSDKKFDISCSKEEWTTIWHPYFDLSKDYFRIAERSLGLHPFTDRAIEAGRGLRILRQEPWEMLISFIISQRKNIPAISRSIEALCEKFGSPIDDGLFSFPTPKALAQASDEALRSCSLGYRAPYVSDAANMVLSGAIDPDRLDSLSDDALLKKLMEIKGVGIKVASCVALFAYGRYSCVPVDVWIKRAIEEDCGGVSPFPLFGENAGIIQQYVFYYERISHV